MSNTQPLRSLQKQLAAHRARLATLLIQVAIHGTAHAPPAQISDIDQARHEIARLKRELRSAGSEVADQPDDGEHGLDALPSPESVLQPQNTISISVADSKVAGDVAGAKGVNPQATIGISVSGSTVSGDVVGAKGSTT
jgi:hypothetical protein